MLLLVDCGGAKGVAKSSSVVLVKRLECGKMGMMRCMCSVTVRDGPMNVRVRMET